MRSTPTSPTIRRRAWPFAVAALASTGALGSGQAQAQNTAVSSNSGNIDTAGSAGGQYADVIGSSFPSGTGSGANHFDVVDFSASAFSFSNPSVIGVQGNTLTLTLTEAPFGKSAAGSPVEVYLTTNNTVSLATTATGATPTLTYQTATDTSTTNAPHGIDPTLGVLPGSAMSASNSNVLYDLGGTTSTNTSGAKDTFTLTLSTAAQQTFLTELGSTGGGDVRLVIAASSPTSFVGYDGTTSSNALANRPSLAFTPVYNTANNLYWQAGASTWTASGGTMWNTTNANPGTTGWNNDGAHLAVFNEATGSTVGVGPGISAAGLEFDTTGYTLNAAATGNTLTLTGVSAAAASIQVASAVTATINVPLAGTVGITKNGAGTLVLGGTNTYAGGTTINAGTLQVSSDANLGAASTASTNNGIILSSGTLYAANSITTARAFSGSGSIQVGSGNSLNTSGIMNVVNLTLPGAGTVALTNASGSLSGSASNAITGTLTFNTAGATLTASGSGTVPSDGQGIINLGGITATQASGGTVTVAANVNLSGTATFNVANSGATLSLPGGLAGMAAVAKTGAGTLVLGGENSGLAGTGTGPTSFRQGTAGTAPVSGGIISISAANPDPTNALGTGVFDANGGTLSNDTGTPITTLPGGISLGAQNASTTPGGLVFTGSGTNPAITVSGPISLYNGSTAANVYEHTITVNVPTTFTGLLTASLNTTTSRGLTFAGTSTLTLMGTMANTLFEPITIATTGTNAGVIAAANGTFAANTSITINAGANLTISTGAMSGTVNTINDAALVSFASTGGTFGRMILNMGSAQETVGGLYLAVSDGTLPAGYQPAGTYGAMGSGAKYIDNTLFSGTGVINDLADVTAVPEPSTWMAMLAGLALLASRCIRRGQRN